MTVKDKNFWILLLCMLSGITLGNFIGELCANSEWFSFLSYGQSFGLESPLALDFGALFLMIQAQVNITLSGVIGLLLGIMLYRRI